MAGFDDWLCHSRTKGSKNGVRLYQNKDGSLTPLGREHYRAMYKSVKKAGRYGSKAEWKGKTNDSEVAAAQRLAKKNKDIQAAGEALKGLKKLADKTAEDYQNQAYKTNLYMRKKYQKNFGKTADDETDYDTYDANMSQLYSKYANKRVMRDYNDKANAWRAAQDALARETYAVADSLLGKYANKQVKTLFVPTTARNVVRRAIEEAASRY